MIIPKNNYIEAYVMETYDPRTFYREKEEDSILKIHSAIPETHIKQGLAAWI